MKLILSACLAAVIFFLSALAAKAPAAAAPKPDLAFYRRLTQQVPKTGRFSLGRPEGDVSIRYAFELARPIYPVVKTNDFHHDAGHPERFIRYFWDRIFLQPGSQLQLPGRSVPLTCVFVEGQDNRHDQPLGEHSPKLFVKVWLVANDPQCIGPIDPNWPQNGKGKETWDTYLKFRVSNLSTMLPEEGVLRYRWNEQRAVFTPEGALSRSPS